MKVILNLWNPDERSSIRQGVGTERGPPVILASIPAGSPGRTWMNPDETRVWRPAGRSFGMGGGTAFEGTGMRGDERFIEGDAMSQPGHQSFKGTFSLPG